MRRLLNDPLDPARMETGSMSALPAPVVIDGLVDEAKNTFQTMGSPDNIRYSKGHDQP